MKKYFSLIVLIILSVKIIAQTNFYVDKTNGNDGFDGSFATPWKTIQKAANSATPNSIVNIKANTYFENVVINVNGTSGNYIIFKNYQNDVVNIDGTGTAGGTLLTITNKSYLKFQNLTIQNKTINDAQGILVQTTGSNSSTDLTFSKIKIKNIKWTTNASTVANATQNAQGFIAYGRNGGITKLKVDSCEVSNNILGYSEALAINGNIDGFSVTNCLVHDNNNIGIDVLGHEGTASPASLDEARNGVVSNNICYNNVSNYATSAGIYIDGAKNILIEKNICYQNGWGIEVGAELDGLVELITVKNNLIYNNQQAGLSIGGYDVGTTGEVKNCTIRNNTFFQNNSLSDGTGEISITKASNNIFENNIFYTKTQNVLMSVENINPQTGNTFRYNNWYTPNNNPNDITVNWRNATYSTFATYKTGAVQDNNSTYENPSFVSNVLATLDLKLQSTSNNVNTGNPTTTISTGEKDYFGNNRVESTIIDKGAYEYSIMILSLENVTNQLFNNSNKTAKTYSLYPNPSTGIINIKLEEFENEAILTIFNDLGTEIIRKTVNDKNIALDLSQFKNGMYFINISTENNVKSSKFLISK